MHMDLHSEDVLFSEDIGEGDDKGMKEAELGRAKKSNFTWLHRGACELCLRAVQPQQSLFVIFFILKKKKAPKNQKVMK